MSDFNAPAAPSTASSTEATTQTQVPPTTQTPAAPEAPKQDDRFAAKFAALDRKSREIKEREKALETKSKAEVEAARKEADEYKSKYGKYATYEEKMKTDKREALKFVYETGLTPEELSDLLLEDLNPSEEAKRRREMSDTEKRLMDQIEALKSMMTEKEKAELDKQKQAEQEHFEKTVTQVKTELKEFIDSSEDFDLIKLSGEYETVFDVMQEHYNDQLAKGISPDNIKLLSYEEAAKWTESYLEEDARKKYEAKAAKKQAPPKPETQQKTSPTLSNTLSTEVQAAELKPKTREESLAKAARQIRFIEE